MARSLVVDYKKFRRVDVEMLKDNVQAAGHQPAAKGTIHIGD
jgi:hypothetical protein